MSINSSSGKYDLQRRRNFSLTSINSVLSISFWMISFPRFDSKICAYFSISIIKNSLPMSVIDASSISSKSSLNEFVSFLGFLMAAINKFVSTKNSRMFFSDFFFNVTSHLTGYRIDIYILKIFLKLICQCFDVYFFDNQKVIVDVCDEQFRALVEF